MGNCIIKESPMQWGGEDWGTSFAPESDTTRNRYTETERTGLLEVPSVPKAAGTKLKIRISRKQLSDMLNNADAEGLSAHEVLARVSNAGDRFDQGHRLSWTPALQSIPE